MDPMTMMKTAAVLFAIAALGGLVMAGIRFSGADRPPSFIAMLHGVLAAAGLTLLIYAAVVVGLPPMALAATGILVVVALVGAGINLQYHARLLPLPKPAILIHGAAAVAGFSLLLIVLMK